MLPEDIVQRIEQDFNESEVSVVKTIMLEIFAMERVAYYGYEPACRSILYIAEGDLSKIVNYFVPLLLSDPRDLINAAEEKTGFPDYCFNMTFPEVKIHFEKLYEDIEEPPAEIWEE